VSIKAILNITTLISYQKQIGNRDNLALEAIYSDQSKKFISFHHIKGHLDTIGQCYKTFFGHNLQFLTLS
jgi:hypothetical protein